MKQDTTLDLQLNSSSPSPVSSSSIAPSFDATAFSMRVKAFCNKISLPAPIPIKLTPVNELEFLLSPPSPHIQLVFSQEEIQELIEICQGFAALDFSL